MFEICTIIEVVLCSQFDYKLAAKETGPQVIISYTIYY